MICIKTFLHFSAKYFNCFLLLLIIGYIPLHSKWQQPTSLSSQAFSCWFLSGLKKCSCSYCHSLSHERSAHLITSLEILWFCLTHLPITSFKRSNANVYTIFSSSLGLCSYSPFSISFHLPGGNDSNLSCFNIRFQEWKKYDKLSWLEITSVSAVVVTEQHLTSKIINKYWHIGSEKFFVLLWCWAIL